MQFVILDANWGHSFDFYSTKGCPTFGFKVWNQGDRLIGDST